MTPMERIEAWDREFRAFRRKVYVLVSVGFALIITGLSWTSYVFLTNQHDVHRVTCANSQSQVTSWEFVKMLAMQNQTGTLTKKQIQLRQEFYDGVETLSHQRGGDTCPSLREMRAQAKADIRKVLK